MTNPNDFLNRVEHEVLKARAVSESTCAAFADLPLESRAAYGRAMRFLGCQSVGLPASGAVSVPEVDRIRVSRLMLLGLHLDTDDPRWSSWMLDRLLEAVMGTPGGNVGDLLHALQEVLEEYSCDLSWPVRNLIRDLVIKCFSEHGDSYQAADWTWMVRKTIERSTPAQAYLALLAIPPDIMPPRCAVAILKELEGTPYQKEATNALEEDLHDPEARACAEMELEELRKEIRIGIDQADRGEMAPLDIEATLAKVRNHHEGAQGGA
jgi:hypothetical protein